MTLVELQTDRLLLRPYSTQDADRLHALWTDPQVRHYLFDNQEVSQQWVVEAIDRSSACFQQHGVGQWCVVLKETADLIGFAGFFPVESSLQLLYGLHPHYWGQGLATEAVKAVIRYGFEARGLERIVANTDAANVASAKVMQRSGLQFDRRTIEQGLDLLYFSIDQHTYNSRKSAEPA